MNVISSFINSIAARKGLHFYLFLLSVTVLTVAMMYLYKPICVLTDPYFHYNRLLVLMNALQNGEFPFYLDYNSINGYGYFTKAFYCDLFLIPYALVGNFSDIYSAYDFYIFSTTILSALTMYWAVKRIYKSSFCASVVGILYVFSAYRIYEIYYHTAVAEVISFIFIPVVLLGFYEIIKGDYKKWYILTLGYSAIIMTHTITVVLLSLTAFVFLIYYCKCFLRDKKRIVYLFIAGFSCLFLTAYYLYPMLEQMFSNSFYYQTKPFVDIKYTRSLLSNIFAGMTNNLPNMNHSDYTPKVGGLLVTLICLRLFIHDKSKMIRSVDVGVVVGLCYIFTNIYFFPWTEFPFNKLAFIQFPWRLLKYTTFFFSLAGGFYLYRLIKSDTRKIIVITFLAVFLVFTFRFDSNDYRDMICVSDASINEQTISKDAYVGGGEYLPSVMSFKNYPYERGRVIINKSNNLSVNGGISNEKIFGFYADSALYGNLELPLTYYKGYKAVLDDNEIEIKQSDNGLIEIPVSRSGYIRVWYEGTIIQKISPYISILGILLLCGYIYLINRKKCSKAL